MRRLFRVLAMAFPALLLLCSFSELNAALPQPNGCGDVQPLTTPTLLAPSNGTALSTIAPLLEWEIEAAMVTTGMRADIHITTDPTFQSPTPDDSHIGSLRYNKGDAPRGAYRLDRNLLPGTTYYWRVYLNCWTGSETHHGPYSEIWSFTTGSNGSLPAAPSLISPLNNADVLADEVVLRWTAVEGAHEYQVSLAPNGWSPVLYYTTAPEFIANWSLLTDKTYYWWVVARNEYGYGPTSVREIFTPVDRRVYLPLVGR